MANVAEEIRPSPAAPAEAEAGGEEFHSSGTLVILLIYLVLIVVLWGSMFLVMLERS